MTRLESCLLIHDSSYWVNAILFSRTDQRRFRSKVTRRYILLDLTMPAKVESAATPRDLVESRTTKSALMLPEATLLQGTAPEAGEDLSEIQLKMYN